jgi:hypothetical protein
MQILGIPVIRVAGVEADDVIGTVASRAVDDGFLVAIASPDKVRRTDLRRDVDRTAFKACLACIARRVGPCCDGIQRQQRQEKLLHVSLRGGITSSSAWHRQKKIGSFGDKA